MKRHCVVWAAALYVALALPVLAAEPSHEHAGGGDAQLELDHGRKWPTDEALRQGMTNMRAALAADLKAIHANKASDAQYKALATKLNAEVAYVVANCKLEPKADAELHKVIAEILAGAEAMQGGEPGVAPRAGAVRVVRALDAYGRFFDHPGWKGL
ncbi:MAG TPA: hypothetical protein VE935_17445 [Burkholderiales bacterium]|nr:hypothetical protein [Burkholderiales bacterium]